MPSYYDLPAYTSAYSVEDVNKYQKLPFWLTMNEIKRFPYYKTWDVLFGKKKWSPNMGSIMRGVRPEPSPVGDSFVFPQNITSVPNKNVFETFESVEEARLKLHRFESKQFNFLPSFQDFRDNQLKFNHDDIVRQIALYNERFIRGVVFSRSPNILVAGNNGNDAQLGTAELLTNAPVADVNSAGNANLSKTTAYLKEVAGAVGQALTLKVLFKSCSYLDDDLGALPFEGTMNVPRENELVKGKYVCILGTDAWRQFTFDDSVAQLKSINLDLLFDGFKGSLFGNLTCKPEKFPLRMDVNGNFIAPQITDVTAVTLGDGSVVARNKTRPNPNYTNLNIAAIEWAFLVAADGYNSITVGPPPSEFSAKSMSAEKFYSLRWNGEVQLTDQVLIQYPDGTLDLNRYGTQLQLISQAIFGVLPAEVNNVLPIVFKRRRITTT